ncbi:ABC transporter permease [Vreelandella massiliensis]|uniref:ABC transporter permease n=1 Tax=Vreelandella massiliensis TaxID=1816686 RepID=UPI00096ABCAD|nr:ABC transporter permease [Halomonas massiliensis]MYL24118.1 ABC transporter permease subunit [Halomonas alkaliantarctica]
MPLMDALPTQGRLTQWRPNWVMVTLGLAMLVALWGLATVSVAPNRIVSGTGYPVWQALGWGGSGLATLIILAILALASQPERTRLIYAAQFAGLAILLLLMPFGLMAASHWLIDSTMPQARLGIGPAYWVVLFLALLGLVELRLRLSLARGWMALLLVGIGAVWWLCAAAWLDRLALVQEFLAREAQFYRAIREHLALVAIAVSASIALGMGVALLMRRFRALQRGGFALLNFFQTIPSLALFGLLLGPLAWLSANLPFAAQLGIKGIGWTPALIALIIYSLLPIVRNTYVALEAVSPDVLDAAMGMGMRPSQRFWQVRVPLALPILLEGVRITLVQAIGLTAVAALIGAGGLGAFIFQGLGQAAMDMVLLGALPILVMALVADAGVGALADQLRRGAVHD